MNMVGEQFRERGVARDTEDELDKGNDDEFSLESEKLLELDCSPDKNNDKAAVIQAIHDLGDIGLESGYEERIAKLVGRGSIGNKIEVHQCASGEVELHLIGESGYSMVSFDTVRSVDNRGRAQEINEKNRKRKEEELINRLDTYLDVDSTERLRKEIRDQIRKDGAFISIQRAIDVIGNDYVTLEQKLGLIDLLDDIRCEEVWQYSQEDWDLFIAMLVGDDDSALLAYKAEGINQREGGEDIENVPIEHAKEYLIKIARQVIKDPGAAYMDEMLGHPVGGKWFSGFSDAVREYGEDKIWDYFTDEEIRGMWAGNTSERGSDIDTRERLAAEHLRGKYIDRRKDVGVDSEEVIVTEIASGYVGEFDLMGRLKRVAKEGGEFETLEKSHLFAQSDDQEDLERKTQAVRDVGSALDLRVRKIIEEDYDISFSELTLREVVWFASTLRYLTPDKEEDLMSFVKQFGMDGARALMSAEFGDEFREYVLMIGEKVDNKTARKIFETFSEISTLAQTEASKLLEEFFVEGKGEPVDSAKIEMELMKRAKRLIEDFARDAIKAKATGEEPDSAELLKKLEQANSDTALFASIFRAAYKGENGVDFEKIQGVEFETANPQDLDPEDRDRILAITDANWEEVPTMSSFIHKMTKQKLETPSDSTQWHLLKKGNDIVAFCRFDDSGEGELYGGSFNVAPEHRGSAIGDALFQNTLDVKAKDNVIKMNVYPDSDVASSYIEKYGFVITDVEDVLLPGGGREVGFKIMRDDSVSGEYKKSGDMKLYNLSTEKEKMLADIRQAESRGEVVTRFIVDKGDPDVRKLVFEKRAEKIQTAAA